MPKSKHLKQKPKFTKVIYRTDEKLPWIVRNICRFINYLNSHMGWGVHHANLNI